MYVQKHQCQRQRQSLHTQHYHDGDGDGKDFDRYPIEGDPVRAAWLSGDEIEQEKDGKPRHRHPFKVYKYNDGPRIFLGNERCLLEGSEEMEFVCILSSHARNIKYMTECDEHGNY